MTSTLLLTTIAVAAALMGGAAQARAKQAQPASLQADRDSRGVDVQGTRADRGNTPKAWADGLHKRSKNARQRHRVQTSPDFRVVPNNGQPDDVSYGWQYFSDPRVVKAVVISPVGEYFLSQGNGPRQITGPAGGAWIP